MKIDKILLDIVRLPRSFNENSDKSIYALLMETGYADVKDKISVNMIRSIILKYPEYSKEWMQYSADKRATSGWYIRKDNSGKYIVGHLPDSEKSDEKKKSYDDEMDAYAVFVKREIDSICGCHATKIE